MDNKKYIWWVAIAVVVIGVVLFMAMRQSQMGNVPGTASGVPAGGEGANRALTSIHTREAVPEGTVVPGVGSKVASDVAVPSSVTLSNQKNPLSVMQSVFRINVENDAFSPDTVIVKAGSIATIYLTGTDKSYDFTQPDYGLKGDIPKGQTLKVESQFSAPGKYTFYCTGCGGPAKGPVGSLIVVQ